MKLILIAILVASSYAFDEATFTEQPDDVLLQSVQSSVMAMRKKGATESDCMDLAKTSCKTVETDRSINQRMLNNLEDGAKCPPKGQKGVQAAWGKYVQYRTKWNTSKRNLSNARNQRVNFSSQRYNTMQKGNCGFVFSSRGYINAKRSLDSALAAELILKGQTQGAHKAWQLAVKAAAKMKKICLCNAQVSARKLWATVGSAKLIKKQNRAHTKCKMMACVLKGTNARAAKCQGSLAPLRNKVLTAATRRENCAGHVVVRKPAYVLATKDKNKSKRLLSSQRHCFCSATDANGNNVMTQNAWNYFLSPHPVSGYKSGSKSITKAQATARCQAKCTEWSLCTGYSVSFKARKYAICHVYFPAGKWAKRPSSFNEGTRDRGAGAGAPRGCNGCGNSWTSITHQYGATSQYLSNKGQWCSSGACERKVQ